MIKPLGDIETDMVEIVRSKCPIAQLFQESNFEYESRCGECNFLYAPHKCGWDEYKTKLVSKSSCTDDDDGSGGMPSTDYRRTISCASCGEDIVFSNGFSWFGFRDYMYCPNCGVYHLYLEGGTDNLVFAVQKGIVQKPSVVLVSD